MAADWSWIEMINPHEPGATSNIEHPTPNIEWQLESSLTSAFDVRCWVFDVFPAVQGVQRANFHFGEVFPTGDNSGLQVPLVVYIPDKFKDLRPPEYKPGGKSDRPVSFVDFAPTVLSLAGIQPPDWMQGHAFLGKFQEAPQSFVHGFRGRMDERDDLVRSVTDGRYDRIL